MKKFLALGLTAGLLAVGFSSLSSSPAEACRQFSDMDRRAQARAIRQYEQQLAGQQYQYPNFYSGAQYPYAVNQYPVNYSGYYPPAIDNASYYPQSPLGYSQYYPGYPGGINGGLNAGVGGGLVQNLLSLF